MSERPFLGFRRAVWQAPSGLPRRRLGGAATGLSLLAAALLVAPAAASQRPLCAPPAAGDVYYNICRVEVRSQVTKLLYDLSIDHLYRPPPSFQREVAGLLQAVGMSPFYDPENPAVREVLEQRGSVEFTRLDESSGEFISKGTSAQTVSLEPTYMAKGLKLDLSLPETIQGLYWRSPIQLDLMFYKGHSLRFQFSPGGSQLDQDIVCISVTPERTRVLTTDPNHRHLIILYEDCP